MSLVRLGRAKGQSAATIRRTFVFFEAGEDDGGDAMQCAMMSRPR
jgi:hypothetical protein